MFRRAATGIALSGLVAKCLCRAAEVSPVNGTLGVVTIRPRVLHPISRSPEQFRLNTHTTIWTGNEMIVFGGGYGETLKSGRGYNPTTDSWTPGSTAKYPGGPISAHRSLDRKRNDCRGELNDTLKTNSGGRYDPALNTWTPTKRVNAPRGREAQLRFGRERK